MNDVRPEFCGCESPTDQESDKSAAKVAGDEQDNDGQDLSNCDRLATRGRRKHEVQNASDFICHACFSLTPVSGPDISPASALLHWSMDLSEGIGGTYTNHDGLGTCQHDGGVASPYSGAWVTRHGGVAHGGIAGAIIDVTIRVRSA